MPAHSIVASSHGILGVLTAVMLALGCVEETAHHSVPTDTPHALFLHAEVEMRDICEDPSPRIALTLSPTGFAPLTDGDSLEIAHGAQGGWHFSAGVRAWNLTAPFRVDMYLDTLDGEEVSATVYSVAPTSSGPCSQDYPSMLGTLNINEIGIAPPEALHDQELVLTMVLEDAHGVVITDVATVVGWDPDTSQGW